MNKYADDAREAQAQRRAFLACESKRRYATVGAAQRDLPEGQVIYSCARCRGWHRATAERTGRVRRGAS
jgi:hypothetical protein